MMVRAAHTQDAGEMRPLRRYASVEKAPELVTEKHSIDAQNLLDFSCNFLNHDLVLELIMAPPMQLGNGAVAAGQLKLPYGNWAAYAV